MSVLTNPPVTEGRIINNRFSDTPFDCSFVSFAAQQTLVELASNWLVVAVEKWKAFLAFQAERLFHGQIRLRSWAGVDVDSLSHWTARPMRYEPACWQWQRR